MDKLIKYLESQVSSCKNSPDVSMANTDWEFYAAGYTLGRGSMAKDILSYLKDNDKDIELLYKSDV